MALPRKPTDRQQLMRWLLLGSIVSVAAFSGYVVLTAASGAADHILNLPLTLLTACLSLAILNYFLRSVRWSLLCAKLGVSGGFGQDSLYYLAGFPMGMTPGKVGDVVRLWLIQRSNGRPMLEMSPLLVADRAYDMIALALLVAFGASMFANAAWAVFLLMLVVGSGAVVMIGLPSLIRRMVDLAYRLIGRFPRAFVRLRQAASSFSKLASWKLGATSTFVSLVGWFAEVIILKLAADFFGVDLQSATAITIVVRACTLWFSVLVGLIGLPLGLSWAAAKERQLTPLATAHVARL